MRGARDHVALYITSLDKNDHLSLVIHITNERLSYEPDRNIIEQCAFVHVGRENKTMNVATSANSHCLVILRSRARCGGG